jgi:hypothetical protein
LHPLARIKVFIVSFVRVEGGNYLLWLPVFSVAIFISLEIGQGNQVIGTCNSLEQTLTRDILSSTASAAHLSGYEIIIIITIAPAWI